MHGIAPVDLPPTRQGDALSVSFFFARQGGKALRLRPCLSVVVREPRAQFREAGGCLVTTPLWMHAGESSLARESRASLRHWKCGAKMFRHTWTRSHHCSSCSFLFGAYCRDCIMKIHGWLFVSWTRRGAASRERGPGEGAGLRNSRDARPGSHARRPDGTSRDRLPPPLKGH